MKTLYLFLTLLMFAVFTANAQKNEETTKKKMVIVEKTIDANGNEVVKRIVKEGDEVDEYFNKLEDDYQNDNNSIKNIEEEFLELLESEGSDVKEITREIELSIDSDTDVARKKVKIIQIEDGVEKVIEWEGEEGEEIILPEGMDINIEEIIDDNTNSKTYRVEKKTNKSRSSAHQGTSKSMMERNISSKLTKNKVLLGVYAKDGVNGAEILEITENSSAARAGLKSGDVIYMLDDQNIYSNIGLIEHLSIYIPGDKVSIRYYRNGQKKKTKAVLQAK